MTAALAAPVKPLIGLPVLSTLHGGSAPRSQCTARYVFTYPDQLIFADPGKIDVPVRQRLTLVRIQLRLGLQHQGHRPGRRPAQTPTFRTCGNCRGNPAPRCRGAPGQAHFVAPASTLIRSTPGAEISGFLKPSTVDAPTGDSGYTSSYTSAVPRVVHCADRDHKGVIGPDKTDSYRRCWQTPLQRFR